MRWIIPNLLAALAVSSLFSSVITWPTGDSELGKGQSVDNDFGDEVGSYDSQPFYGRREITESLPGLSEHPDSETHVGYGAILERVPRPNTDKPNDDADVPDVDQEDLATALEAIHLESHSPSIVSRGQKEEAELSSKFGSRWKGETFYYFIEAKDKNAKNFNANEIKSLAKKGYELIKDKFNFNGNVIVSALFIPEVGVAVGSKPRGTGVVEEILEKSHKTSGKNVFVGTWFERYWAFIDGRDLTHACDSVQQEDLYHAEDLVIIKGADEYLKKMRSDNWRDKKFPRGTHMVSYGKYNSEDKSAGPKEPCGGTEKTKLTIPCKNVAHELNIDWST
ncbi:hypothetical protein F9C07_11412 [Aspergillus flavus]|uniref:Uncharacterized protein n=2 Tax=Aspergillus flavus TaxID=5059 RepID=B8NSA0_ASPFN|nr:uncharacterized protein G4B84_000031 [Aspergillus flavus NRRL3357]KAB8250648.1 hypothetical protein BDV35DRAFT_341789 [Aspergillus flavus]KAF7630707.1 hypothetical protein AFLA_011328 [Aspergillus flavus NRRL3357]KAJ1707722.1 hypothetical protein NYO67_10143 [Aspergillus flavus]QMW24786.1 hypothetical protein G4B84_000031 [Aspergillus flavus NRRL3357]QRD89323.1 hypothetical protein F9C07_11412 [Aspergillus flavus]